MKFGRVWRERIDKIPHRLAKLSINYKNWKKLSKSGGLSSNSFDALGILKKKCKKIDDIFIYECKKTLSNHCFYCNNYSVMDLIDFADINKKTLYKICKRLDKRNGDSGAMKWLNQYGRRFKFVEGFWISMLESNQ